MKKTNISKFVAVGLCTVSYTHLALISFLRTFGVIMIGLLIMPQFIGITGVWLAVPIAQILTLCISLYLNFRLWLSWKNQNNSYEKNTERLL